MGAADWWAWTLPATLQASVLLGLAWAADRLLIRRVWPQVLALLWLLALARFFLPPDFGSPLSVTASLGEPTLAAAEFVPGSGTLKFLLAIWIAGAASLLVLRAIGRARLLTRVQLVEPSREWRRTLDRAARIVGSRRTPRIGTVDGLATPALIGLFRPILLLPSADLLRAPTRRDVHAVLHEFAHRKRGDLWLDEGCAALRAILWFHPLVWIAVERLHVLGELQCDQTVARLLGSEARSYRDTLVLAAHRLARASLPRGVRAFASRPSAIVVRIERLNGPAPRSRMLVRGVSAGLAFLLAACVLPMAPRAADLRREAQQVLDAARRGERPSCFVLHTAAMVLAEKP